MISAVTSASGANPAATTAAETASPEAAAGEAAPGPGGGRRNRAGDGRDDHLVTHLDPGEDLGEGGIGRADGHRGGNRLAVDEQRHPAGRAGRVPGAGGDR